ncbi:MAG: hypothetical protein IKS56_07185 [Lachnospiraceae bacterium]|nr:hypothetical protein [Lachnospiraceae bacterium]
MGTNKATGNKKNIEFKVSTQLMCLIIFFMGALFYFLGLHFQNNIYDDENNVILYALLLNDIFKALGTTLVSAAIVSFLIEISTIKKYAKASIDDVLSADYPLDAYSDNRLKDINLLTAAKLGNISKEDINSSLYNLNNNLVDLLDEIYYKDYYTIYTIKPDEKNGVTHKIIRQQYTLINKYEKENQVRFKLSLRIDDSNKSEDEIKKLVKITKFIVNKTNLIDETKDGRLFTVEKQDLSSNKIYTHEITFERKLQKCCEHKVILEYEYDDIFEDDEIIYRLMRPSMKTEIDINVDDNDWILTGTAFTAFYYKQDDNHGFSVSYKSKSFMSVKFNDWCIPGAGFMVKFKKKEEIEKK